MESNEITRAFSALKLFALLAAVMIVASRFVG